MSEENIKFACSGCGLCCKNIGKVPEIAREHGFTYDLKEDGSCEMLDESNQCKVYNTRPDICRVDRMYEILHKPLLKTRKEIYLQEAQICNTFIRDKNLDEKFLINLNQYN